MEDFLARNRAPYLSVCQDVGAFSPAETKRVRTGTAVRIPATAQNAGPFKAASPDLTLNCGLCRE